jgi:hypothetical protein
MIKSHHEIFSSRLFVCFLFFLPACMGNNRKEKLEHALNVISVDSSQHVLTAEELAEIYNRNPSIFKKTFHDSSLFVKGNIQSIDEEHGEILLTNSYSNDIICLTDDSIMLSLLRRSDKVLFKGVCKSEGGPGLILIDKCELAQIVK